MRIIFHIGMGKTGTSSIQQALTQAAPDLRRQSAHYLGMWFDPMLGPEFLSHEGMAKIAKSGPEVQYELADRYLASVEKIAEANGSETLIHSNEGIFGHSAGLKPFFERLVARSDLRLLCYVRRPQDWLPSAFTQWNIRHKQQQGPVQSFGERGRTLIKVYDALMSWQANFPEHLDVRLYDKGTDVVQDFAYAAGIDVPPPLKRYLERSEPAETVLRAIFNDRFKEPIMPDRFNRVVQPSVSRSRALEDMAKLCFAHDGIDEIVAENEPTFAFIRDTFGFDFLSETAPETRHIDMEGLRNRLFDILLELSLDQANRLKRLERLVADLQEQGGKTHF